MGNGRIDITGLDSTYSARAAAYASEALEHKDAAAESETNAADSAATAITKAAEASDARDEAVEARDDTIDISGISTSDAVVEALVKNTGGAGPLTTAALNTAIEETIPETAPAKWEPTSPYIGPRSDAYFIRASDDGDQRANISAFLADANIAGKKRLIGYANVAGAVTVPGGTWLDATSATIKQTVTGGAAINITGSNVRIVGGLNLVGPNAVATARDLEHGIYASGASAASPLQNLHFEDLDVERFGKNGIYLRWVDGITMGDCDFAGMGYAGIAILACKRGRFERGLIDSTLTSPTFSSDGYGIHFSRSAESSDLVTHPRSEDMEIRGYTIKNIWWEGIDTHGGDDIRAVGNTILGCRVGIMFGGDDPNLACKRVTIIGNRIDSQVTNGTAGAGIILIGAPDATGTDPALDYAQGIIMGNKVRNHGLQSTADGGAIHLRNTQGSSVIGNLIEQPGTHGVVLYYDNRDVTVVGNTVADPWSNTSSVPAAIAVRGANNTGVIMGNTLVDTEAKASATYVNKYGIYNGSLPASVDMTAAHNEFSSATTGALYDVSATGRVRYRVVNPIRAGANGAATPAYSFDADPSTGLFNSGAGQLAVSVSGTMRGRFLTTGWLASSAYAWDCAGGVVTAVHKDVKTAPAFAAAQAVNWSATNLAVITMTGNITSLTFSNPNSDTVYELHLVQDATGSRTLAGSAASIKWAGGTAPTLTTTGGKRDIFRFRYDGTNYYEISRTMNVG